MIPFHNLARWLLCIVLLLAAPALYAASCPSSATFSDSFEDGALKPWKEQAKGQPKGDAGVDQRTAGDGSWSAFAGDGPVTLESPKIDLRNTTSAELTVWIRRGADSFSESPDNGNDAVLEYKNDTNDWVTLETFNGGETPGEIFSRQYTLPADARHKNFRLRLKVEGGSGNDQGYWHLDDVCLTSVGGGKTDHYAISHDSNAVSCDAEHITITAHNNGDNPVDPGNVTIALDAINQDTGNGEGTWARVVSGTGTGTLADATAGDGAGQYTFPGGESSVTLAFNYTDVSAASAPETVNFDVNSGQTEPTEDPDLVVSRSGFRITDGAGNPINVPTQIAGKSSATAPGAQSLGLQAIRTSDGDPSQCEPAFPDGTTVEVELGAECKDPATCAGSELAVTNDGNTTAVDTSDDNGGTGASSYEAVELLFGASAEASLALEYPDAGALQLHARANPIDDGTTSPPVVEYITGSSNDFVVRPFGFYLDFDPEGDGAYDDRAANSGCGSQTSCSADASGDVFATAGTDFALRIAAVGWQSADDADDDGRPDGNVMLADNAETPNFGQEANAETVDIAHALVAPSGGASGTLANGAGLGGFGGGAREVTDLRYSEVGIISLDAALSDGAYLSAVDVTGTVADVGRFIPADFAVGVREAGMYAAACDDSFTYVGQSFGYNILPRLDITARNATGATTQNYRGTFIKLSSSDVDLSRASTDASAIGNVSGNPDVAVTTTPGVNPTLVDAGDGDPIGNGTIVYTADGDDRYTYDKVQNARIAPFGADLPITVQDVTDDDGVTEGSLPSPNPFRPAGVQIRFGRLLIENAAGSEIAPIKQELRAEYFESDAGGDRWLVNTDDGCTAFALAAPGHEIQLANDDDPDSPVPGTDPIDVAGGTTSIQEAGPVALTSGTAVLTFSAPGAANTGWVDTTALLTGAEHPYLAIDPEGDGSWTTNPTGRVTFGIYTGRDSRILLREIPAD